MRDRRAERAFAPGPLDIHMNPLVIAGAGRKLIDPLLLDRQPIRDAELTSDKLLDGREMIAIRGHVLLLLPDAREAVPWTQYS